MKLFIFKIFLIVELYFYMFLSKFSFLLKNQEKENSILFITTFFPGNSGYHWRAKEWASRLEKEGFSINIVHAIEEDEFYNFKDKQRARFLILYLHRRFWQVIQSRKYEKVIVRRELLLYNDYGNLFLDKLLLKIHPNAILDFDDDIAYAKKEPRKIESFYARLLLENGTKFTDSIKLYKKFIVGSEYLKKYVLERNETLDSGNIIVLPTCVNYDNFEPKKYDLQKNKITFGWIGGNHNLFLLENVIEPLNQLSKKNEIELLVIAGKDYENNNASFTILNKKWSLETEKDDIRSMDIGLMPLLNTDRDKGKCSFKLIQYMGMGVVSLATNVGMNNEVIDEIKNESFLVDVSWLQKMEEAIAKKEYWQEIGQNARNKIQNSYSYTANLPKLVSYLKH